jgi:hypothetical protein
MQVQVVPVTPALVALHMMDLEGLRIRGRAVLAMQVPAARNILGLVAQLMMVQEELDIPALVERHTMVLAALLTMAQEALAILVLVVHAIPSRVVQE